MAAEPRTCSRTTTGRGQDSPESTAPDVSTALRCLSGASTTPTAPEEDGAQTSRAQRGALAPGTIMGRTGYETTRPRARAFENYHGPSSSERHGARRPWEGGRRMDGSRRSGGRALVPSDGTSGGKGLTSFRAFAPRSVQFRLLPTQASIVGQSLILWFCHGPYSGFSECLSRVTPRPRESWPRD